MSIEPKINLLERYSDSLPELPNGWRKVVAVIFDKRNKVVSFGNNYKTHPKAKIIEKYEGKFYQVLHAEVHALIQAERFGIDLSKCSILVMRKRKDGKFGISKPCPNCQAALNYSNIQQIYYFNEDGLIEKYYD